MNSSNLSSPVVLLCLLAFIGEIRAQAEIPEETLISIRDAYDQRAADMFNAQKRKSFEETFRVNWNESLAHSYPRVTYAAVQFWFGQDTDEANVALDEYGQYFVDKPDSNRMNVGWHTEVALRLIEMYGSKGRKAPGLLKPETERIVMEGIWTNVKAAMQEGSEPSNTMTDTHTKDSQTWHVHSSENLHAQSFTTRWNFALLAKDMPGFKDRKYDDGNIAAWHYEKWTEYLKLYYAERAKKGIFIELMSRDYNEKTVKGMFNVYDFSPDPELKRKARSYLDLYFTYLGQEQIDGISGGGKSRLYSDTHPSTSWLGYVFFGIGDEPRFEATIIDALTTTYRPPLVVVDIACDIKGRGNYEIQQRAMGLAEPGYSSPPVYQMRTDFGGIVRYSYCTPDFIVGAALFEARPDKDWAMISSQNQSRGVIFAGNPAAGILPQCKKINKNRLYNAMWSVQRKGTQISQKLETSRGAGQTVVWISGEGLGAPIEDEGWVFVEAEGAYAAVRVVDGGYFWEDQSRRVTGNWLICSNEYSPIILEVDQKSNSQSFDHFKSKIKRSSIDFNHRILGYTGLSGDTFTFYADQSNPPRINNTPVNYAPEMVYDSPFLKSEWNSGVVHIQKGTRAFVLDFN